jgi:lipopolysaccharide biosynthesis protein
VLDHPELDLPFCLSWANENWTRGWDGLAHEVLMEQTHSAEDDMAFIYDIEPALRDPRYIRVQGRPLLMVYQPDLFQDMLGTIEKWREYCRSSGIGDLYVVTVKRPHMEMVLPLGFDGLVECPPFYLTDIPSIIPQVELLNPEYEGQVIHYKDVRQYFCTTKQPDFPLFRTVLPSWDNEARKPGRGMSVAYSNPEDYKEWLRFAIQTTRASSQEKIIFVNAWNEWAEGAHLEPDRKYGYAWLQATYDALAAKNDAV